MSVLIRIYFCVWGSCALCGAKGLPNCHVPPDISSNNSAAWRKIVSDFVWGHKNWVVLISPNSMGLAVPTLWVMSVSKWQADLKIWLCHSLPNQLCLY